MSLNVINNNLQTLTINLNYPPTKISPVLVLYKIVRLLNVNNNVPKIVNARIYAY